MANRHATTGGGKADAPASLQRVLEEVVLSSDYAQRRAAVDAYNAQSSWRKRGIAVMPIRHALAQHHACRPACQSASNASFGAWCLTVCICCSYLCNAGRLPCAWVKHQELSADS